MFRHLSKSRIMSGLQCPKRLWLEANQPTLAEVDARTERSFAVGHSVGAIARTLWPDGHLVGHDHELDAAIAETQRVLAAHPDRPLFEGTFRHDGVLVRVDVLHGGDLIEVKAASQVKDYHLTDCAVQAWVLAGAHRAPTRVLLAHIDTGFVYPGGGDYRGLLALEDVTAGVNDLLPEVPHWVDRCRAALADPCPTDRGGRPCHAPFDCPFLDYCTPPQPDYPVTLLPYGGGAVAALQDAGFIDLRDVPADLLANATHERVRRVTASGVAEISPELVAFLAGLPFPRVYLDFETVQFAVPIWAGTRPYEQLPFQWSCHTEFADGLVDQLGFLDTSGENPLREFAVSLLDVVAGDGPILVYTSFEKTVLSSLQQRFPALAGDLQAVIDRLVDLHPPLRAGYYHPAQKGSWSIKAVAPLIAQDMRYEDLAEVRDGGAAQAAYLELIDPGTPKARKRELGRRLLEYCRLDTLAMVRTVEVLTGRSLTYPEDNEMTWGPIID